MIRIVQISDIHWTVSSPWEEHFAGLKSAFLKEMENIRDAGLSVDYLFVCGDIAFKGDKDAYNQSKEYISHICQILGCNKKDVFVVPGNHDVDRKSKGFEIREVINQALATDVRNEEFLKSVLHYKELYEPLFAAFKDYNEFAKEYLCHEDVMNNGVMVNTITEDDKMYYEQALKDLGNIKVTLTGVNTALNCDGYDYNAAKKIGHKQILPRRAYYKKELRKQELRILMGHHPLEFLSSQKQVEEDLNSMYQLQFFGHIHDQRLQQFEHTIRLLSGAFDPPIDKFEPDKYKPVFNIVEITEESDSKVKIKCNARIWKKICFEKFGDGCFDKSITIEQDINPWIKDDGISSNIDVRAIKFKFMEQDNKSWYFTKIPGIDFTYESRDGYTYDDACIDFLTLLEQKGKLNELNKLMSNNG